MKRAIIKSRKAARERMIQQLRRGQKPFHGARGAAGAKDAKDLRGAKGVLLKVAEDLAAAEEVYGATGRRRAPSRSSSTAARR